MKGKKVPQAILEGIGKENLAKDMYQDPEVAEVLRKFESLTIEEDKIILKPRMIPDNAEEMEIGSDRGVSINASQLEKTEVMPKVEESNSDNDDDASFQATNGVELSN